MSSFHRPPQSIVPLEPLSIPVGSPPNAAGASVGMDASGEHDDSAILTAQQLSESLSQLIRSKVVYYNTDHCPFVLPETPLLDDDKTRPSLRAMFNELMMQQKSSSHMANLERLALDPVTGRSKRLSKLQLAQLAETGQFRVAADQRGSGKDNTRTSTNADRDITMPDHVWKVASWLQTGRLPILKAWQQGMAKSLYHVMVGMPRRLYASASWSVIRGLLWVYRGIYGLLSLLIGLPETVKKYSSKAAVDKQLQFAENNFMLQQLGRNHPLAAMFDNELQKQLQPLMDKLQEQAHEKLRKHIEEDDWFRDMPAPGVDGTAMKRKAEQYQMKCLFELVANNFELERASKGYGKLWVDRMHLEKIISDIENELDQVVSLERERLCRELVEQHPILSGVKEWLQYRLDRHCETFRLQKRHNVLATVASLAMEQGIGEFGSVYSNHLLAFREEQVPRLQIKLENEVVPAAAFDFRFRIWRSKNWVLREETRSNGGIEYIADKYILCTMATNVPLWRLVVFAYLFRQRLLNGLYWICHAVWNGPIGLKSLVLWHAFPSDYMVDSCTGDVIPDPATMTSTLRNRLGSVWRFVLLMREDFEALPDTGLIGKSLSRIMNMITAYVGVAIPATVFVLVGQPIATAINVTFAGLAFVTAPLWAIVSVAFTYAWTIIVCDRYSTNGICSGGQWFPAIALIWRLCMDGVFCCIIASGACFIGHPTLAIGRGFLHTICYFVRNCLDSVMLSLLLRPFGRIPGHDSFLAWRVAGPGITKQYTCYLLPVNVALLALSAKLQECELSIFEAFASSAIKAPLLAYQCILRDFSPFGLTVSFQAGSGAEILRMRQDKQLEHLQSLLAQRRAQYGKRWNVRLLEQVPGGIVRPGVQFRWIKQGQSEAEETLRLGTSVVRKFWETLEERYTSKELNPFWFDHRIFPNDFALLTKHLLSVMFSDDFLCPVEETDEILVLPLEHRDLEYLLTSLF